MKTATALIAGMAVLGISQAVGEEPVRPPLAEAIAAVQAHGFNRGSVSELADLLLQAQGRATIIGHDGQRRDYTFGPKRKIRLKDGGALPEKILEKIGAQ